MAADRSAIGRLSAHRTTPAVPSPPPPNILTLFLLLLVRLLLYFLFDFYMISDGNNFCTQVSLPSQPAIHSNRVTDIITQSEQEKPLELMDLVEEE